MIKLYLDVSEVIHASVDIKYANCKLPVNFQIFLLMTFCFMMKKNNFQQKMILWAQFPFKDFAISH